jgi:hypothetical protein
MGFLKDFSIQMGANILLLVLTFINNMFSVYLDEDRKGRYFPAVRFPVFTTPLFGERLRLPNMNIAGKDKDSTGVLTGNARWYSLALGLFLALCARFFILFSPGYPVYLNICCTPRSAPR